MKLDLNKKIVFILGAGASHPYGFPLGNELKNKIEERLVGYNGIAILEKCGFTKELIANFVEALRYSFHSTIDIFLENKTSYRSVGAYAIALALMPYEKADSLFPHKDWYATLYNFLKFEDPNNIVSNLSIVTLNYDRSIDHFLIKNVDYNHPDKDLERAREMSKGIQIVHAHGSLGGYPIAAYGSDIKDIAALRVAAEGIKITSDHLNESKDFRKAQEIIATAEQIVFLGFGFEPRTLSLLFEKFTKNSSEIISSNIKLPQERKDVAFDFFGDAFSIAAEGLDADKLLKAII